MEEFNLELPIEQVTNEYATQLLNFLNITNDERYALKYIDCLKAEKITKVLKNIDDIEALLYRDNEGKSLLENILSYNIEIEQSLLEDLVINENTMQVFAKNESYLFDIKIGDMNVIEYTLYNFIFDDDLISRIFTHPEIITLLVKYNRKDSLRRLNEGLLFLTKIDGVSSIEYLFQNNLVDEGIVSNIRASIEIVDLILKYNRQDLLKKVNKNIISLPYKNFPSVFDYLLSINADMNGLVSNTDQVISLYNYKRYDVLSKLNDVGLMIVLPNGQTVLDYLLSENIYPKGLRYSKKGMLDIIINNGMFDIACKAPIDKLLELADLNTTYLEILIRYLKNGKYVPFGKINPFNAPAYKVAQFYIIMAKNGLINYVKPLTIKKLLSDENGGKIIDELIDQDKDLTLNVILNEGMKSNIDLAMYLKLNGIEDPNLRVIFPHYEFIKDYLKQVNQQYFDIKLNPEDEKLLNEFRDLMINDKKSKDYLVDLLIGSYRYSLSVDSPIARSELQRLIEMKKANPEFALCYTNSGAFFSGSNKTVNLSRPIVNVLNHEMGHAMFHILADAKMPEEFPAIIDRIRSDPKMLDRVQEFSIKYHEIYDKVDEILENTYMKDYDRSITEEKRAEIAKSLEELKTKKIDEYEKKGFSRERIDAILSKEFTVDDYLKEEREIVKSELNEAVIRCKYPEFSFIGDILDAIYVGRFAGNALTDNHGNPIKRGYGHGIHYYDKGVDWAFDEMMAQTSQMLKSPGCYQILPFFRRIVGDELVDFLINFYCIEIVNSPKYQNQSQNQSTQRSV